MTFEEVFTYATLGLTLLRKLVEVAKWGAAKLTPNTDADDRVVGKIETWLGYAESALGFVPTIRLKLPKAPVAVMLVALTACAGSVPEKSTILREADEAYDTASEVCLLAHSVNARTNAEPMLGIMKGKIDAICEPALEALDGASAVSAVQILATLRAAISELLQ